MVCFEACSRLATILGALVLAASLRADANPPIPLPLITMKMESAHPADVIAEFSKQTGILIAPPTDEDLRSHNVPASIGIDLSNETFWSAFEKICVKCGFAPTETYEKMIPLYCVDDDSDHFGKRPASVGVGATFLADSITREVVQRFDREKPIGRQSCTLSLIGRIDPRLRVVKSGDLEIDVAVDEQGRSLVENETGREQAVMEWCSSAWNYDGMSVPLRYDPHASKKLALLKGTYHVLAAVKTETFVLDDLAKSANRENRVNGMRIRVDAIDIAPELDRDKCHVMTVRYRVTRQGLPDEHWKDVEPMFITCAIPRRRDRMPALHSTQTANLTDAEATFELSIYWQDEKDRPTTIDWEIPVQFQEVDLPFEFHDLKLP